MEKKNKTTMPKKYNRVNIAGLNIKRIRIQRMEAGLCAINDIQLVAIAEVLHVTIDKLLDESPYQIKYPTEENPNKNVAE